jgi:hypothetical protein
LLTHTHSGPPLKLFKCDNAALRSSAKQNFVQANDLVQTKTWVPLPNPVPPLTLLLCDGFRCHAGRQTTKNDRKTLFFGTVHDQNLRPPTAEDQKLLKECK